MITHHHHRLRGQSVLALIDWDTTLLPDDVTLLFADDNWGQIRRLPVLDKNGRLVGVVSLGDLSTRVKEKYAGETLESISR